MATFTAFVAWAVAAIGTYVTVQSVILWIIMAAIGAWQASRARRAARDAFNASLRDRLVSVATTTAYRSRCYGETRNVDGVLFKGSHGPDKRYYTFVVAVAGHEIESFTQAYFGDVPLVLDVDGYVQTEPFALRLYETISQTVLITGGVGTVVLTHTPRIPGLGGFWAALGGGSGDGGGDPPSLTFVSLVGNVLSCTANIEGEIGFFYQSADLTPYARVRFYNGTPTQDLSGDLIALGFTNILPGVHRFAGIACMLITLTYSPEAYSTGLPQFTASFKGARCLDRRTGTTAYTTNPAVIADDWSCYAYGGGLLASEIAAPPLIGSANACDVPHTFNSTKADGTPGVPLTAPMYECGIVCKTEADPSETLSAIVESMAGQWGWASGKLRIKAGYYTAPVVTIDDTWFSDKGSREFNQGLPTNDMVNVYNPQIADRDQGYIVVPVASVRAVAYIISDGRELPVTLALEGVTDVLHAQHVCGVMLRHSRQGLTISIPCNFKGIFVELFDTVAVNLARYGLVDKTMEVAVWSFSQDGGTVLLLREVSAGIFDPDAGFSLLDASPNTTLPLPWTVPVVEGLAVVSGTTELSDASIVTRTRATWDAVESDSVLVSGKIEVSYMLLGDGGAQWATLEVPGDATEAVIVGLMTERNYVFMVRARNSVGVRGAWSPIVLVYILSPSEALVADIAAAMTAATAAAVAAAAAQLTADNATTALVTLASDNVLSPVEKPAVVQAVTVIQGEQAGIDTAATGYGITTEKAAYDTAVAALNTYLGTLTGWNVIPGSDVGIVGATFRSKFADVYSTRQTLLNKFAVAAKALADAAQSTANAAVAAAATAQSAANSAQTSANTANAGLTNLASDNILSPGEKSTVILDYAVIVNEQAGIDAQAVVYQVTTEKTAYDNAVAALTAYLGTLTGWNTVPGSDVVIVGTTFRTKFSDVYSTRQNVLNTISSIANLKLSTRPNLLVNGGFERGWVNWGGTTLTVIDDVFGRAAYSFAISSGTGSIESDAFIVVAASVYTITGDSVMFGTSGSVYFDMQFYSDAAATVVVLDGPQNQISGSHNFATDDSNRKVHAVAATAPAGAIRAKARFVWQSLVGCTALGCRLIKVELGGLPATRYSNERGVAQAFTDATAAAASAAAANAALTNIASDSILSPSEKPTVVQNYSVITSEQAGIDAQAVVYSITTEKTAYDAAVSALTAYLATLTGWNTIPGGDVAIVGSTFRANFAAVYTTRQTLLNKISETANGRMTTRPNLCPNGCFERYLDGWNNAAARGFAVADNVWGRSAYSTTASGTDAVWGPNLPAAAGAAYTISGDSLLFAASGSCYFDLLFYNAALAYLGGTPGRSIAATHDLAETDVNRRAHETSMVAPAGTAWMIGRFVWNAVVSPQAVGFRQMKIERGGLPSTPYTVELAVNDIPTSQILPGAATVVAYSNPADGTQGVGGTWSGSPNTTEFVIGTASYTNNTGGAHNIEVSWTALGVLDAALGLGWVGPNWRVTGSGSAWPGTKSPSQIPVGTAGANQVTAGPFSGSFSVSIAAGGSITVNIAIHQFVGSSGGAPIRTVTYKDVALRITAVKR